MAKAVKTITINAPVEKVFGYVSEPTNLPEIWPSLVESTDVQPLPNGGHSSRWVYKMAGMRFEGTSPKRLSTSPTNAWLTRPRAASRAPKHGCSNPRPVGQR